MPIVLCLTEHWLDHNTKSALNSIYRYKPITNFVRSSKKRGGSCVLVNSQYKATPRADINSFSVESVFECCGANVQLMNVTVVICIYRAPSKLKPDCDLFFKQLQKLLIYVCKKNPKFHIILCGDFNIDILESNLLSQQFLTIIDSFHLHINIFTPTRTTSVSQSCIDNIITSFNPTMSCSQIVNIDITDHDAQLLCTPLIYNKKLMKKQNVPKAKIRIYSDNNIKNLKNKLASETWTNIYDSNIDVNKAYNNFLATFLYYFNNYIPLVTCKSGFSQHSKGWVTDGIRVSSNNKRYLHFLAKSSKDPAFLNYVRKYKLIFKRCIQEAKRAYNNKLIRESKNRTKAAWKIVKADSQQKTEPTLINTINFESIQTNDSQEISTLFNKFFNTTSERLLTEIDRELAVKFLSRTSTPAKKFHSINYTSTREVKNIIKNLKASKSAGWDGIPTHILKKCSNELIRPLCFLINKSIDENLFPEALKYSIISPIFKKGNPTHMENYRPISLLPAFSKIFEKVVAKRLLHYFEENNVFFENQFGFRRGRNTTMAINEFVESIMKAVDGSQYTVGVFCDLSKAFDCVNHELLISKLRHCGVEDGALKWVVSYLTNQKQSVKINKTTQSEYSVITAGIRQGSVLGPLMYLVYSNDLSQTVDSSTLITYVDDTTSICQSSSEAELINILTTNISNMTKWFNSNGLQLNKDKTYAINFHSNYSKGKHSDDLYIQSIVNTSHNGNFLGLKVDPCLKWNIHIDHLSKVLSKSHFVILSLSKSLDIKTLKMVYYAYVYSNLTYGVIFWGNSHSSHKIFKIQKRIIRIMTNSNFSSSCRPLFKELKILPLPCIYILNTLMFVKENLTKLLYTNQNQYSIRNKKLHYPTHRLAAYETIPSYSGRRLYNGLPVFIQDEPDTKRFKVLLHRYLIEHVFYSVEEYLTQSSCK